jgi:hypothetical protein
MKTNDSFMYRSNFASKEKNTISNSNEPPHYQARKEKDPNEGGLSSTNQQNGGPICCCFRFGGSLPVSTTDNKQEKKQK